MDYRIDMKGRLAILESIRADISPELYAWKRQQIISSSSVMEYTAALRAEPSTFQQQTMWDDRVQEPLGDERPADGKQLLQKIKDAGVAGLISYGVVQVAFWGASIPFCILAYYQVTGHWPDLTDADDQAKLAGEAFAFLNFARLLIPLRVAVALAMTQGVQANIVDRFFPPRQR